ncbi:MAG: hypothetical protein HQL47_02800 [Gammaproteobacteria bacterium]|nr:hypothetical protein [Gammaproteobacteria bacterium]
MSSQSPKLDVSNRALEMIMRDVLEGMEDLSLRAGYSSEIPVDDLLELVRQHPLSDDNRILYFPQPLKRIA